MENVQLMRSHLQNQIASPFNLEEKCDIYAKFLCDGIKKNPQQDKAELFLQHIVQHCIANSEGTPEEGLYQTMSESSFLVLPASFSLYLLIIII